MHLAGEPGLHDALAAHECVRGNKPKIRIPKKSIP
jgi:hypothetical protein